MNKANLVSSVAEKVNISKKDADNLVTQVCKVIEESPVVNDKVQLIGFDTFEIRERAERVGRNPQTKEMIAIPTTRVPVFKPGQALKDVVKEGFPLISSSRNRKNESLLCLGRDL